MMVSKGKLYFVNFILPELVAKRYTSVKAVPQTSTSRQQNALSDKLNQFICYCQDPVKNEETVMCASTFCVIHEFHKTCTGSKRITESWLCTFCKKETAATKRKSGRNNQLVVANSVELVEPNTFGDVVVVVENCESMNAVEVVEISDINLNQPQRVNRMLKK